LPGTEKESWKGWHNGYGIHWGFDGLGERFEKNEVDLEDVDLLELRREVLLMLLRCESLLLDVEIGTRCAGGALKECSESAWVDFYADEGTWTEDGQECAGEWEEELSIIELYEDDL
jgi:hypothetical protein